MYKGLKDQTLRQTGKGCGSLLTLTCAESAETGVTWCPEHPCTSPGWRVTACCCSVTQSCPTLLPHGLQHSRLPCPSPSCRTCSNSCPLSRWCHPTISSSVVHFSSCLQSFPALGSSNELVLCIRWPKYWSFSFSISPSNEFSGLISFRMDWLDPLAVQGTESQGSSLAPQFKSINSSVLSFHYSPTLTSIHDYWKNHSLD